LKQKGNLQLQKNGGLQNKSLNPIYALLLSAVIWVNLYFFTHYDAIAASASYPPRTALIAGAIAAVIAFILTIPAFGWIFPILTSISILYMAFGFYLPSSISTPSVDLERMITLLSADVTSPWGVYGSLLILSANYLFLFIFFGSALEAFGGLRFVIAMGNLVAYKFKSGAAALSVFSSALLGSLTGSTAANITITGSFTMPMMKKTGYSPEHAAAIETSASSGGQILPPIMGATAFVMSGYTGIPYIEIAKACFIPAIIYFATVLLYVELSARKFKIAPMPAPKINKKNLLFDAPIFICPLATMLILLIQGRSLMFTIFWSLISVITFGLLAGLRKEARLDFSKCKERLMSGIIAGSEVAVMLSLIGIMVAVVDVTGLGMKLGNVLLLLSHNKLALLLIITAVTAMVLGVGLPSVAAYIICATILSPSMIKLGVPDLQANLFPLYYAVFAHLTPPIAFGLIIACKMAKAKYWPAAGEALKAASASFLLPFFFIYAPAILLQFDGIASGIQQFVAVLLSLLGVSGLLIGYWATRFNIIEYSILIAAVCSSFIFIFVIPHYLFLIIGGSFTFLAIILNIRNYRTV